MYIRVKNVIFASFCLAMFCLPLFSRAADVASVASAQSNKLLNVSFDDAGIVFETEKPINGEYAVYDSIDPLRVVVDFSGMQTDAIASSVQPANHPFLTSIRASSFDLSSDQMGRVELLLKRPAEYDVEPLAKGLRLTFKDVNAGQETDRQAMDSETRAVDNATISSGPASVVGAVQVSQGKVVLVTDGEVGKYRHFSLENPARLVVDLYRVKPGFDQKSYSLSNGFSKLRVGADKDKTRFVLDGVNNRIPATKVVKQGNSLQVTWGQESASPATPVAPSVSAKPESHSPVVITAVDFHTDNGQSILAVELSGAAQIHQPERHGEIVRFGVENAAISRSLRRSIDASAFPSAVRLITPYLTRKNKTQAVWFAVEFKGQAGYSLRQEGNRLLFVVEDGPYAELAPLALEKKIVPLSSQSKRPSVLKVHPGAIDQTMDGDFDYLSTPSAIAVSPGDKPAYTGQKVTLVFDDANIRNILQLIAEVSNLNIIAGDDIKGTITLRLVEVPWDQALDLIMDIKNLGMLRDGNVVRIMPREKIQQMQEDRFKAARTKEELEDLVTDSFSVSYSDIKTVADQVSKRKTDRGKIIEDTRNKRIIVTDIPSVVDEIRSLITLLDLPVRQVLIEARIVEANASFSRDLGVNWGLSYQDNPGSGINGNDASISGGGTLVGLPVGPGEVTSGLVSGLTFGQVGVDKAVLDLRLAALEQSGHGRIISTPRVSTLNGEEAEVAQGTEIPYLSVSDEGTKTEFKKAELSLKVTPEINPDGSVILEIEAKNDSRGANTGLAEAPAIDTKRATTKVLVKDGETTVIGGIFIQDRSENESGVPWLMNIPVLGYLFKSRSVSEERRELLVFITPRILD